MKKMYNSQEWNKVKKLLFLLLATVSILVVTPNQKVLAQIYEPEGLNMPGSWNGWTNPPTNLVLANNNQQPGGELTKISIGTQRWQTVFSVAATGADLVGGTYAWLFTSGPSGNYSANKWAGVTVTMNSLQNYSYNTGADNSITLTNDKWYTMNWEDKGYVNTRAIFMETSAEPVSIASVYEPSGEVDVSTPVDVTISTSATPCAEEIFYLRYTTDSWTNSSVILISMTDDSGTAQIPGQTTGTVVEYYVFSSSVSGITTDFDLYTIKLNNDAGTNYTYTVGSPYITWANIQHPESGSVEASSEFNAFARVQIPTITGADAPVDGPVGLSVWIGYSTTDATTIADFASGWTWVAATYQPYEVAFGNKSEYKADIGTGISTTGTYYFVSRFKYNDDAYEYGGYNGGFWDGTTNVSGELTVVPEIVKYPVSFEVTNNNTNVTQVKIKGTFNAWTLVPMVNSTGNTWTYDIDLEAGTYQWGVADQDDSWLLPGDDLEFTVSAEGTITGTTTYIIPPPPANFGLRNDGGTYLPTITYWYTGSANDVTEKGSLFNGKNLGEIAQLFIKGASIKTWKTGDGNVTGAKFSYKVWKTSDSEPVSYIEINVGFTSNDGDGNQTWSAFGDEFNVANELIIGTYNLKIFFSISGTGVAGTTEDGPFSATFEIPPSHEAEIVSFTFPQQTGNATINSTDKKVEIEVAYGTALTSLTPTIEVSANATIDPLSGVAQNFSSPFVYTVTAQDGATEKEWTVYVTAAAALSSAKEITGFTLTEQTGNAAINSTEATVDIEVAYGTSLTSLTPTITISPLASISPNSGVAQNFSSPVIYTVTAEDDSEKEWTVTVSVADPPAPNFGLRDDGGTNLPSITYWFSGLSADLTEKGSQFNAKDMGEVQALYIKGSAIKTWKTEGGNVTSAKFSYKVWKSAESEPAEYTDRNVGFSTNDGDGNQTWAAFGEQINIADALELGIYNIKILFSIEGTGVAGTVQNGPFTAIFEKVETVSPQISYANLQHPGSGTIQPESEFLVYGRVFIDGVTGSGAPVDGVSNLSAWIGFCTTNAAAAADFSTGWTWVSAAYNAYDIAFGNNSQYSTDIGTGITAEGTYYYVSRFQLADGNYVYGGFSSTGGGLWDGTNNVSGVLTVETETVPSISWANLQHPDSGSVQPESEFMVFAQLLIEGQTGSGAPSEGIADLEVWIGYSSTNATSPTDFETGWTWVGATYNTYDVAFGNNSQYSADIGTGITAEGTYYYVSRFQLGEGDFVYGGFSSTGGGFWNGTTNVSGILTVETIPLPEITWANLQYPENGIVEAENEFTVFAQVFIDGFTGSISPEEGVANLTAWIGYCTTNATSPANFDSGWTWIAATYNAYEVAFGNNSQYSANIGAEISSEGTYYYVSRFQMGDGNYVYGGFSSTGGGFWDGASNISGVLTVEEAEPVLYPVPFTITDATESLTNVKLKLEVDGVWQTHSMAEVNHVWSKSIDMEAGTYLWGAIEDDGSAEGIWLIDEGNLEVTIADNGAVSGTIAYTVNTVDVIHNLLPQVIIYPNPTSNLIYIDLPGETSFEIIDISGRIVKTGNLNGSSCSISFSEFKNGLYFIRLKVDEETLVEKVVKY